MSQWGQHYLVGDVVLTIRDGLLKFALCTDWTGDYHHRYVTLKVEQITSPQGWRTFKDKVTVTEEEFHGYYIGPKVGHLSPPEVFRLGEGVEVSPFIINTQASQLAGQLNECLEAGRIRP